MKIARKIANYYQPGDEEGAPPALYTQGDYDEQGHQRENKGFGAGLGAVGGGMAGAGLGALAGRFIGEKANIKNPDMARYAGMAGGSALGGIGGHLLGRHGGMPAGAGLTGLGALTLAATTPEGRQLASELWNGTHAVANDVGSKITEGAENANLINGLTAESMGNVANNAANYQGKDLGEYMQNAANSAGEIAGTAGNAAQMHGQNVMDTAKNVGGTLWDNIRYGFNGLKNHVTGGFEPRQ